MREFGVYLKEMDMIDEQLLSPDQIKTVCASLFGVPEGSIPHPEADFNEFYQRIEALNAENPPMYSLHMKRPLPLVDVSQIRGGRRSSCAIQ